MSEASGAATGLATTEGGSAGSSASCPIKLSPRHWRACHPATHFTEGLSLETAVDSSGGFGTSRLRHFAHPAGFTTTGCGAGSAFAQQQFSVEAPQGTTHPQAFTVCLVWMSGKPNAATACANTSTSAIAGRAARFRVRESRGMVLKVSARGRNSDSTASRCGQQVRNFRFRSGCLGRVNDAAQRVFGGP